MRELVVRFSQLLMISALAVAASAASRPVLPPTAVEAPLASSDWSEPGVTTAVPPGAPALRIINPLSGSGIGIRARVGGAPVGAPRSPSDATLAAHRTAVTVSLRAALRSRLGFTHDGVMARAGAHSSFGTSLPPPLFA